VTRVTDRIDLPCTADCFVCGNENAHGLGLRFAIEGDTAVARLAFAPEQCGYRGIVHGGVLAAVLDETMGWAASYAKRTMCVAGELTVRYVKSVPVGVPVQVTGRLTEDKRRLCLCEGTIQDDAGTVYVKGSGTFVPLSPAESARIEAETLLYADGAAKLFSGA
jgi:uncharacterized protein (TIGR00369 family)